MKLLIGIMAAPRPVETVDVVLDSLKSAGFGSDLTFLFCEPGEYLTGHQKVVRPHTLSLSKDLKPSKEGRYGNFQNFVQTLRDLVSVSDNHDAIMIVEDDAVFASNVRPLVSHQIDSGFDGMLSLYTPNVRQFFDQDTAGFRTVTREWFFGGLALVLPIELAKKIAEEDTRGWPGSKRQPPGILAFEREASDAWIGRRVRAHRKLIKGWNPSMVSHYTPLGRPEGNSSRVDGRSHTGPRQAKRFIGEGMDAEVYFKSFSE